MILQNLDSVSEKSPKWGFLSPNFFQGHLTKCKGDVSCCRRTYSTSYDKHFEKIGAETAEKERLEKYSTQNKFVICRCMQSLDFSVNRFFMKLFLTSDMSVVNYCQLVFQIDLASVVIKRWMDKFEAAWYDNVSLVKIFSYLIYSVCMLFISGKPVWWINMRATVTKL